MKGKACLPSRRRRGNGKSDPDSRDEKARREKKAVCFLLRGGSPHAAKTGRYLEKTEAYLRIIVT